MVERLTAMVRKEFVQFFRDISLVLIVLYMFLEVAICGWALTMDYKNTPIAVLDQDQTVNSQKLINQFEQSDKFRIVESLSREKDSKYLLDEGKAKMIVVIPSGFSSALNRGEKSEIQLIADGENETMAAQVLGNSAEIITKYTEDWATKKFGANLLYKWN
ncbi:ABC transporter permease [Neobacillus sp. SM06]|uniref:ABC transporter permease n=1 Tax=Neobacillus sp. SM06 TaxID=3422492 RepID=UPI003D2D0684